MLKKEKSKVVRVPLRLLSRVLNMIEKDRRKKYAEKIRKYAKK